MRLLIALCTVVILSCTPSQQTRIRDHELVLAWSKMTLDITRHTPANTPTYASRCLGYIGLTMYECVVHGFPDYQSLAGQLSALDSFPQPDKELKYDWAIVLNAGQASILRNIYNQTSDKNKQRIDSLESAIQYNLINTQKDKNITTRSVAYGQAVANALFEWSKTDGGHRGYLKNFDKSLINPVRPGAWKPPLYAQSFSHHPLHPHWGENRTFVPANAQMALPEMIEYSEDKNSPYFAQFQKVYDKKPLLTQEEKEIAIWWADDPDVSFTPPGHSYYLAGLVIKKTTPDLVQCAETMAKTGMSVADAFINCWKWKYHFFSERPNTYISQHIDEQWESFWPDPPFPAFPSGHAIQASASCTVLIDMYGEPFTVIDSAHVGRERDELRDVDFKPRSFDSFWQIAEETANSRFYGGIHTPQDNQVGLEQGKIIAQNVIALKWKK